MTYNVLDTIRVLESHAKSSGYFQEVFRHEPKSAPTAKGMSLALWLQEIRGASGVSGLQATTARVEITARIYLSMLMEPQDDIDSNLASACVDYMARVSSDFDLGETVRNVDLLGSTGTPFGGKMGYLTQDGKVFRVMVITIPCIVNDVWGQVV